MIINTTDAVQKNIYAFIIDNTLFFDDAKKKCVRFFGRSKFPAWSSRMLKSVGGGLVTSLGYWQLGKKKALLGFCSREFHDSLMHHKIHLIS